MSIEPLERARILEVVKKTEHLPAFPRVVTRLEQELAHPKSTAARLAAVIETDPALCASVLRLANSAIHRGRSEVVNVAQAVSRLGMKELRRMALAAGMMGTWPRIPGMNLDRFWIHSVAVGLSSAELARRSRPGLPEPLVEASFSAGILHDVGALVLWQAFPDHCRSMLNSAVDQGMCVADVELESVGIDHGEVASALATGWNLPLALREVMIHHHRPWLASAEYRRLVQLVHIADFFCNNQGFGRSDEGLPPWFDPGSWDALGLQLEDVRNIVENVVKRCDDSQVWVRSVRV